MADKNIIPPIREFPDDGRTWRIDWLGGLKWNPSIPDEPVLRVLISPLRKDVRWNPGDLASVNAVEREQRTIEIGVGQLPYLFVGSLWHRRHCQNKFAGEVESLDVSISTATARLVPAGRQASGHYLIPVQYYFLGEGLDSVVTRLSRF